MTFTERDLKCCVKSYLSTYRWNHIQRVEEVAQKLLIHYPEVNSPWLTWAIYAHDATKEWSRDKSRRVLQKSRFAWILRELREPFWHGYTAVLWLEKKLGQSLAPDLEEAMEHHSLGNEASLSPLAHFLFVCDFLDPVKLARRGQTLEDFLNPSLTLEELYQKILLSKKP